MKFRLNGGASLGAAALVALSLAAPAANAICLMPSPVRVCTEFFHTSEVMVGKVLSVRRIPDTPDPNNVEGWFYKFQIEKSYRGDDKSGTIEIYTGNDETKFPLEVGHRYVLFANRNPQGRLAPEACGNSAELGAKGPDAKGESVLQAIEKIATDSERIAGADIDGRVVLPVPGSQAITDVGAPGIPVIAHGFAHDYKSVTDKDGRFHFHVTAGPYDVVGASDVWNVVPYPLAYMRPNNFAVFDGGCAELVLVAQPK